MLTHNRIQNIISKSLKFYRGRRLIFAVGGIVFVTLSAFYLDKVFYLLFTLTFLICLLILWGNSIQTMSESLSKSIRLNTKREKIITLIQLIAQYATQKNTDVITQKSVLPSQDDKPYIVIYQMGKVGSRSIESSISALKYENVYHIHYLQLDNLLRILTERLESNRKVSYHAERSLALWKPLLIERRYAKYITIVRNPIERNFSAFFHGYANYLPDRNEGYRSTSESIKLFFESYEHDIPLTWFNEELNPVLNINIFDHPFPVEQGYQRLQLPNGELLILKLETGNSVMERALAEFFNLTEFTIVNSNEASDRSYNNLYRDFKASIVLPEAYVERMLNSQYTLHFYSDSERNKIREYWDKRRNQNLD